MKRTVKDPDERRSELVASAQQLFFTKGYENTSVSEIVGSVGVAQGTFYYYFDSKQAILEAVVEELAAQTMAVVRPVIADPNMDATTKLNLIFQLPIIWKTGKKEELLVIARTMGMPENLPLQHRLGDELTRRVASEFALVVVQGIQEGVFDTEYPQLTTEHAFAVMTAASDRILDILINQGQYEDPALEAWNRIRAAQTAIERLLGAPCGSLFLTDKENLNAWFAE
jgi:AcrR family transcriptional regulator